MNRIPFSHNWNNKLECVMFTTFRKKNEENMKYYTENLKKEMEANLFGTVKCKAVLVEIQDWQNLTDIPKWLLIVDTGQTNPYPVFAKFGIRLEGDPVIGLLFKRVVEWVL